MLGQSSISPQSPQATWGSGSKTVRIFHPTFERWKRLFFQYTLPNQTRTEFTNHIFIFSYAQNVATFPFLACHLLFTHAFSEVYYRGIFAGSRNLNNYFKNAENTHALAASGNAVERFYLSRKSRSQSSCSCRYSRRDHSLRRRSVRYGDNCDHQSNHRWARCNPCSQFDQHFTSSCFVFPFAKKYKPTL